MVKLVTAYTGIWIKAGYLGVESPRVHLQGARPLYNIFGFLLKEAGLSDQELAELPLDLAWEKARYLLPEYDKTLIDIVQMVNDIKTLGEADREKMLRFVFDRWHIQLIFTTGSPSDLL